MSLLNDMLHDLGRHQKVAATGSSYTDELLEDATPFKMPSFNWLPSAIIFAVVFSAVLVFKYAFSGQQLSRHLPSAVNNSHVALNDVLPAAQQPLPTDFVAQIHEAASEDVVSLDVNVSADQKSEIADLLLQANRALLQDKLTSPIEDNAYSYFQQIESLVPNHPQAKVGLELIAARYLQMAREQQDLGNYQQVQTYNQRANFVSPEYFQEHRMTAAESAAGQGRGQGLDNYAEPYSKTMLPQSETIKSFPVAEVSSLNVVPNATWKDEQISGQANELLRSNKQDEAIALLKKFIASETKPIRSVILLGDIYSQKNNADALEVLVNNTSFLQNADKAKLRAQMLIAQGDEAAAITVLESELTAADNSESYKALLASLYHKTAQYQKSILSYQRLLNSYGEKPAYWLGLALAFDGLSQHQNALQAYQHLQKFPQLQQQVVDYIAQRIAVLRSE